MTNEDIKHNFSENLIKLRKAKNLTQLAIAPISPITKINQRV